MNESYTIPVGHSMINCTERSKQNPRQKAEACSRELGQGDSIEIFQRQWCQWNFFLTVRNLIVTTLKLCPEVPEGERKRDYVFIYWGSDLQDDFQMRDIWSQRVNPRAEGVVE